MMKGYLSLLPKKKVIFEKFPCFYFGCSESSKQVQEKLKDNVDVKHNASPAAAKQPILP